MTSMEALTCRLLVEPQMLYWSVRPSSSTVTESLTLNWALTAGSIIGWAEATQMASGTQAKPSRPETAPVNELAK